jgi:NAD(P)H dehydrogenase (quinone)
MAVKVQVIFYSLYTHVYRMAEAVAEGARSVSGAQVELLQVAETLPAAVIEKMGAVETKKAMAHIPIADPKRLAEADAILFGSPTRFGSVTAQMQSFFDATGQLWATGAMVGKVGSVFTSTASQHGGQEMTLISMYTFLLHQGMIITGVPYSVQELLNLDAISGGTPYGASTIAGPRGERSPTANELAIARFQGKHATEVAAKLVAR